MVGGVTYSAGALWLLVVELLLVRDLFVAWLQMWLHKLSMMVMSI